VQYFANSTDCEVGIKSVEVSRRQKPSHFAVQQLALKTII